MRGVLWICLSIILIPQLSWGRWLWIPGEHQGKKGCETAIQSIQRRLSTVLNERLQVYLKIDGQTLSCQSIECVRLRIATADAHVGVLTQSQCLKNALEFEVLIVPRNGKERLYKSRVSHTKKNQFSQNHTILAGVKLAKKIIKGPTPYAFNHPPNAHWWSASLGLSTHTAHQATGQGSTLQGQWTYARPSSLYEMGISLALSQHQSEVWSDYMWSFGIRGRRHVSRKGLSPFFGVGFTSAGVYEYSMHRAHAVVTPLDMNTVVAIHC